MEAERVRATPRAPAYRSDRRTVRSGSRSGKTLIVLEAITGVAAVVGGLLLIAAPNGSLLHADPSVLRGTPFHSWLLPGIYLVAFAGVGFLIAAAAEWRHAPSAWRVSVAAGVGLVCFETAEWIWLGFQGLEAVFGVVGIVVAVLAMRNRPR